MLLSLKKITKHRYLLVIVYVSPCESPPTPIGNSYVVREEQGSLGVATILMHLAMPLGLRIQPAAGLLRICTALTGYQYRFHSEPPRLVPAIVRSTVGAKRKTPQDFGWSVTSGGRQTQAFERREFSLKGKTRIIINAPTKNLWGYISLHSNRRLPDRRSEVYMNIPMCQQKNPRIARG